MYKFYNIRHISNGEGLYRTAALSAEHAYSEYRRMRARKAGIDPSGFDSRDPMERAYACVKAAVSEQWTEDAGIFISVEESEK